MKNYKVNPGDTLNLLLVNKGDQINGVEVVGYAVSTGEGYCVPMANKSEVHTDSAGEVVDT